MFQKSGVLFLLFSLAIYSSVCAQTVTGNIRAIVTNAEEEGIEGVAITIRSSALMQPRTVVSNEYGVSRFSSVPVGIYFVDARVQGSDQVFTNRVEVTLGATSDVRINIKLDRETEELTVLGETPLIDLRHSARSTIYQEEMIQNLSTRRNLWMLIQTAPGITTDAGDALNSRTLGFGSGRTSNSWNIDGIDVSAPETGDAWWEVNPDIIQQIQITGVGSSAEYGNHTGAVLNVITRKGSNILHGQANYFLQTDGLTGNNVTIPDSPYPYHRDYFHDFSATTGGPFSKDKIWFFGAFQLSRDASTPPGVDPNYFVPNRNNRYDFKITAQVGQNYELNTFVHHHEYGTGSGDSPPSPYTEDSAVGLLEGSNPAWGATFTSTLSENLLTELSYAGWYDNQLQGSKMGSLEDPYINFDVFPVEWSGGAFYVYDYTTYKHQANVKATYFADQFLKSQHDFKFGAQFSYGLADTIIAYGANGSYLYTWYGSLYRVYQLPFHYGGTSRALGLYVDDTLTVNDRLTLNLGLRFDHNIGSFPDYEALQVGTPSVTSIGNFKTTGRIIPGMEDFIRWNLFSPRLGFVWQTRKDGRASIRGSFGVYYDHDVIGNWDSPPPEVPPITFSVFNESTGEFDPQFQFSLSGPTDQQNIRPPRSLQYSIGYDHQVSDSSSIGVQYVYKDIKDLIGWEILGGMYEPSEFIDPFTGTAYTLLKIIEPPILRKGNDPGDFPGSENLRYYQKYHGLLLTFSKRFSDHWALSASYTYSRSYGLLPRMLLGLQGQPFYGSREGSNPNNFLNADGKLQGDRPHMFRLHCMFLNLPWDLQASAVMEFSSGRAHGRHIRANGLAPVTLTLIMEPGGSYRYSPIQTIDLSIGKRIALGSQLEAAIEGQILNLLNSDQELKYQDFVLFSPDQTFVPIAWVQPRRLQMVFRLQF